MNGTKPVIVILFVVLIAAVVLFIGPEVPDNRPVPQSCNAPFSEPSIDEPPPGQPAQVVIDVVPRTRQVALNRTAVLLICVANPMENNRTVDPIVAIQHSGEDEDTMHLAGRDLSLIPTDNHVGILPMDVPIQDDMGRYVYGGSLEPGGVTQYTVVGSNLSRTGRYDIRAEPIQRPHLGQNEITLTVTCPPSCAIAVGIGAANAFLDEYGMFLLAIVTAVSGILGVLTALYGADAVLSALRFWEDSNSRETGPPEEGS